MSPASNTHVSRRRLWTCVAAPVLAWAVQAAFSAGFVGTGCRFDFGGLHTAVLLASAAALGVTLASGMLAYSCFRRTSDGSFARAEGREQDEMLSVLGVLMSVSFAIGIVWMGLPAVFIHNVCEATR